MSSLFAKPSFPLLVPETPFPDDEIVTCEWVMTGQIDTATAIQLGLLYPVPISSETGDDYIWVLRNGFGFQ